MEEANTTEAAAPARAKPSPPFSLASPAATEESERNPIFGALVGPDGEIAGLVAYSIYKQNKRAWLDDFIKATGRTPTEAETRSYIIGESTERRLATYRQLAAVTLGGQNIRLKGPPPSVGRSGRGRIAGVAWSLVALAVLMAAGLLLLFDDEDWTLRYFVVDAGNLWSGRRVLIASRAVKAIDWSDRRVDLDVSRAQVESSPPWDPLVAFDETYAKKLHEHYGWPGRRA